MIKVIENPVETTYGEAINNYKGYCIGFKITDEYKTCIFKVKVLLYSDNVPDEEFMRLEKELGVTRVMWANPDGMLFPTREEYERMEKEYKNSSAYRESEASRIRDRAFMILAYLAFYFEIDNGAYFIKVYDLRNINQFTLLSVDDGGGLSLKESTMSDIDKCKSLSIIERNKQDLIEGIKKWASSKHDDGYIHQY